MRFCAELARTGRVKDPCRAVGMSIASAYRAYDRAPEFRERVDAALATPRPILERAAFDRAVNGVEVAIHRNGEVVATHRRYSDGLLKLLLERDDRRRDKAAQGRSLKLAAPDAARKEILHKVAAVKAAKKAQERDEQLAWAERMRQAGWAP